MAQRRVAREVAKRIRCFSTSSAPLENATGNGMPVQAGLPASLPGHSHQTSGDWQAKSGSAAAWLLAAGSVTAASAYTVNAGSFFSTEANPVAEKPISGLSQKTKVVFVLGGPGSGKGTQCAKIVDEFGFTHLSAGDLLREEIKSGSEYGNMIQTMIKEGKIVPAEVTVKLLQNAMKASGNTKFLIDGFPRNKENREVFERDTGISPEFILFFDCPEEVMEKRLLGRNEGRIDDNIETIRKRFKTFIEQSMPVVDHYDTLGKVRKVDATKAPDDVFKTYSNSFVRFIEEDLLEKSELLLASIDSCDFATYARLCDPGLTCFEPEAQGQLVEGLPFHEYYFKLHGKGPSPKKEALIRSTIASPTVKVVGNLAVITYTRLLQTPAIGDKVGNTRAFNETRVWQRKKDDKGAWVWKNVHFHRSVAPAV